MSQGRRQYIEAEPYSVNCDTVVELLERIGWEMSADLIRYLGRENQKRNLEADRWRTRCQELLDKYEPTPAPPPRVSYRPPPEASD